jgi:mono/diheme cytochrome c family protein
MRGREQDRYAASYASLVRRAVRRAVQGGGGGQKETVNQPLALPGYQRQSSWLVVASVLILSAGWALLHASGVQDSPVRSANEQAANPRAVVDRYCVTCHNQRTRTSDLALDGIDITSPAANGEIWEGVVRRLRTRSMPPQGMPRPDEATYNSLASYLEAELDRAAAKPNPGRPLIRRLNRSEYANSIRDLFDVELDVSSLLPPDDSAFGFDNISDLLGTSPALLERYLVAADRVSALAVGAAVAPGSDTYRIRQDRSQDQHIEGLPLGTVGGLVVDHTFPLDAEYRFSLELYRTNLEAIRGLEHPHQIEITVDGERVFLTTIGGDNDKVPQGTSITERSDAVDARLQVVVPVKAGPHEVGASFVRKIGEGTQRLRPFLRSSAGTYDSTGRPHIETLTVAGPFNPMGPGETPSRQHIFSCRPSNGSQEEACATRILSTLARRAYRRPVTKADTSRLLTFYRAGRAKGSFDTGIQMALRRLLASPTFVFRVEEDGVGKPGTVQPVSDIELASRLSFFLWSSIPDDKLLDLASRGQLRSPAVLEREVRRMIADPKADSFIRNFSGQWLHTRNLRTVMPNHDEFPDFDDTLRDAFQTEAELFFESIVRGDHNVLDLLTADYTFVNERLAKHYGIPYVYGSHFRRVTLTDDARRGLLGKGGLLMVTSRADRTAPVLRGKWILENVFGTPPPPPLPNVPPLEGSEAEAPRTLRERMERHRASPTCAGCHKLMDPLGFALENFDATGAWRTREAGVPLDASGQLADGTKVDGVVALRNALLARSDVFVRTLTEKLMTYALGRGLQYYDMPVVRDIVRKAERQEYRFSGIIMGIVESPPFQMRVVGDSDR